MFAILLKTRPAWWKLKGEGEMVALTAKIGLARARLLRLFRRAGAHGVSAATSGHTLD